MVDKKFDIVKKFGRLFVEKQEHSDDYIPVSKRVGYMNDSNIVMVVPKKMWVKNAIQELFDVTETNVPELYYTVDNKIIGQEIVSAYNPDYLNIVLDIVRKYDEVVFKMSPDYPLWVETEDFIVVIAPMILKNIEWYEQ